MKKIFLLLLTIQTGFGSFCQVLINPQMPPVGLTIKSQLWNLSLVNTSGGNMNVQLQLVMTDLSTNQPVLSATTRNFNLPAGVKQIRASDLLPIAYTGLSPAYNVDANPNGFLPVGVFNFCYSLFAYSEHGTPKLDEACEQSQIEPLSPPMLISPSDSEHVEIGRPMFMWIPPVPQTLFNNLSYDFHLAEVQPTQTAADAVQQNIPVLFQPNVRSTNFQYPLSAPALDSTKLYAWQVVAKNNSSPVGTSESWSFRLKKDTTEEKPTEPASLFYTRLSHENGSAFTVCSGILHVAYLQEFNSDRVQVQIYDITKSKQQRVQLDSNTQMVHFGENLLNIDLTNVAGIINKHTYLMDLTNVGGEHWYLKFEYKKELRIN